MRMNAGTQRRDHQRVAHAGLDKQPLLPGAGMLGFEGGARARSPAGSSQSTMASTKGGHGKNKGVPQSEQNKSEVPRNQILISTEKASLPVVLDIVGEFLDFLDR